MSTGEMLLPQGRWQCREALAAAAAAAGNAGALPNACENEVEMLLKGWRQPRTVASPSLSCLVSRCLLFLLSKVIIKFLTIANY